MATKSPAPNKQTIRRNGRHAFYTRRAYIAPGVWFIMPKTGEQFVTLGELEGMPKRHHALSRHNVIVNVHGNTEVLVPAAVG